MNKTEPKINLHQERSKKFVRKTSFKLEKSIEIRRGSKQKKLFPDQYLKTPKCKNNFPKIQLNGLLRQISSSFILDQSINNPTQPSMQNNNPLQPKIDTLQNQISIRDQEMSILKQEYEIMTQNYKQEKEKRRAIQKQKSQLQKLNNKLKAQVDQFELNMKRLNKENQYMLKQIQFLQRIHYDDSTKVLQSFRQQYLQSELQKMRNSMQMSKSELQNTLQQQIQQIKQEKYVLQAHFKALKVANECMLKQINKKQYESRDYILNSEEYISLREKYKKFLEEYKQLRSEYWELKTRVNTENDSSILSITFSTMD